MIRVVIMERNGTKKYIETVKYFEKLYDFCNKQLFNNELDKPVITIQLDKRNKALGWFTTKKVWKWYGENETYEINLTAQFLNRPIAEISATLIHEMCHYYAQTLNVQDTSRAGVYHNRVFKDIAEKHGLVVRRVPTIGFSDTSLTVETDKLIADYVKENSVPLMYREFPITGNVVKCSSTRKYVCPSCLNSVRATKELRVACADCKKLMTLES